MGIVVGDRRVVVAVQVMIDALGYDPGLSSGELSPKMSSAITEFQIWHRIPPTGQLSERLLNNLLNKCQIGIGGGGLVNQYGHWSGRREAAIHRRGASTPK
jgi:hypothetical protein